jgi:myo-inositol 2-dehydrogenase/D-chiro-inositol 1-dehydrogenase
MITIAQFGAGRIGAIHAANIAAGAETKLAYVVDVNETAAATLAAKHGARTADAETALGDARVDAVVIASSTDTHADLIERAATAGKTIFCEKPVDLAMARVERCLATVRAAKARVLMGFNRRFDPSFAALKRGLDAGEIGGIELVQITSRDPSPPPPAYVKVSGGLFRDMMIHDLDMARWLLGEEPIEIFATASCLVDPAIGAAGDVDTAAVSLRTRSGRIAQITNSRRAVYGYDQRIEVLGEKGMLEAGNRVGTSVVRSTAEGVTGDKPLHFFLERYADAYRSELRHFVDVAAGRAEPLVSIEDGRAALRLADAANESLAARRAIAI